MIDKQRLHEMDLRRTIDDEERLAVLAQYGLDDGPMHPDCLHLVRLIRERCSMKWAAVTLVERDRQIFRTRDGFDTHYTARNVSFCSVAMHLSQPLVVEDARRDIRFVHNPLVTGDPHLRFYAGFPLVSREGFPLGALCVIDMQPRTLFPAQIDFLIRARDWVNASLELRRFARTLTAQAGEDAAASPTDQKLLNFARIRVDRAWTRIIDPVDHRPFPPRARLGPSRPLGILASIPLPCLCSAPQSTPQARGTP